MREHERNALRDRAVPRPSATTSRRCYYPGLRVAPAARARAHADARLRRDHLDDAARAGVARARGRQAHEAVLARRELGRRRVADQPPGAHDARLDPQGRARPPRHHRRSAAPVGRHRERARPDRRPARGARRDARPRRHRTRIATPATSATRPIPSASRRRRTKAPRRTSTLLAASAGDPAVRENRFALGTTFVLWRT